MHAPTGFAKKYTRGKRFVTITGSRKMEGRNAVRD